MARIRILELPMAHHGDGTETPFAFIIDQVMADEEEQFRDNHESVDGFAKAIGARGTAVFYGISVDLPAVDLPAGNEPVTVKVTSATTLSPEAVVAAARKGLRREGRR